MSYFIVICNPSFIHSFMKIRYAISMAFADFNTRKIPPLKYFEHEIYAIFLAIQN